MIRRIAAISLLSVLLAGAAMAEDAPSVRATVSKRTVAIGDRIRYTIEARRDKNTDVSFPVFADKKIGIFEIKDAGKEAKNGWFGAVTDIRWYDIAAYSVGKFSVPEARIFYSVKKSTERKSVVVKALDISVESVLPKGIAVTDIKDIKPPIQPREPGKTIFWVLLSAAAIIAAASLYRMMRKRKPVRLSHETALEELEAFKAAFLKSGDIKNYYVGISDSVRHYIERSFNLRAPEMTTEEFLDSLRGSAALSQDQKGLLKDFMGSCDLVKFAKYAPSKDEAELVFTTAAKFIEETKDVHI
jgi:hypothetical protein